jgi:uncharacterized SAM-binding protein YcdF (DUF218 family)
MRTRLEWRKAASGAIIATLAAVAAHDLGVQQLIRIPDLSLFLLCAVLGAVVGPTRLRPLLWIFATPVALLVLLIVYTPLVFVLGERLIRQDPLPPRIDAIAVLGHGLTPLGLMRGETLDRLVAALDLAERSKAPVVLVSRERREFSGKSVSDSLDQARLVELTRPTAEIVFVDSVFTTRTEALRMRAISIRRGITSLALVTSPLHTRRACATFEAVGFRVSCVAASMREAGLVRGSNAEDRLGAFRAWLYEMFATASYKSNGWIH